RRGDHPAYPGLGDGTDRRRHDLGRGGHRHGARRCGLHGSARRHVPRRGRAAGPASGRAPRGARVRPHPSPHPRPTRADGARGARVPRAARRARDRARVVPARERGPRGRIRPARAQALARRAVGERGPPPGCPRRLDGGVTRRCVIDLASPRLAWRAPPLAVRAIREALGGGWEVVEVRAPAVSDGDGGSGSSEAVEAARGAEVYVGYGVPAGVVQAARATLRWAHSGTAGVGASLPHLKGTGVVLTNSAALHAAPIADWVIAAIGYFARGLDRMREAQLLERWAREEFADLAVPVRELDELRVGVVGLGGIGGAVARRALALGMSVAGVRRRPDRGGPAGTRWVAGLAELPHLAAESDCLVIAAPHTVETRGAVNRAILDRLPADAVVVNASRGTLLAEAAP